MRLRIHIFIVCLSLCLEAKIQAFQDPSARQNDLLFEYIDTVSEEVGLETFESVSFEYIFAFARQLGQIERFNLKPELFMASVKDAVEVRSNFPYTGGMDDELFTAYILPLRIRYESTTRPQWRRFFRNEFEPVVQGKSINDAAHTIFDRLMERIQFETEFSYDLGYRGDLDPLVTFRGKYGDEVDVSLLACAALRSVGIVARLAYTPHIREARGGKVWVEYMDETRNWNTWVPSLAKQAAQTEHRSMLSDALKHRCGLIFAHPAAPIEITESYVPQKPVIFQVSDDSKLREQYNVSFFSGGFLRPIRGMEFMSIRTTNPKRSVGSQSYWTFTVQNDKAVAGKWHVSD